MPYPLQPLQLSLLSMVTIGIPSFILALEPNHEMVHGKFIQNVLRAALPGGLSDLLLILGIEAFVFAFELPIGTHDPDNAAVAGCWHGGIVDVCKPFTVAHGVLWGGTPILAGRRAIACCWAGSSAGTSGYARYVGFDCLFAACCADAA